MNVTYHVTIREESAADTPSWHKARVDLRIDFPETAEGFEAVTKELDRAYRKLRNRLHGKYLDWAGNE